MPPERGSLDYRSAGVDIDAGDALVTAIGEAVAATHGPNVLRGLGHFGGFYRIGQAGAGTTLVASADGVGTKLKVAVLAGRHDHIGADIVNHCINDILACGAMPLFFLDYFATGKLDPQVAATVVTSIARACRESGVALLGGETAEMPGIYSGDDYDLAGFIVGAVEESRIIDGSQVTTGDVLLGLPSDGFHTNGYSLIRAALGLNGDRERARERLGSTVEQESGPTLGEWLLQPHRCYLNEIRALLPSGAVHGMAHITGGGLAGNVSRVIPAGLTATIDLRSWKTPAIFEYVLDQGNISRDEAFRVFNMGIGFVVIANGKRAESLRQEVPALIEIGRVVEAADDTRVKFVGLGP